MKAPITSLFTKALVTPLFFLPPANEVYEDYVFTGVCLSTGGGRAWLLAGGACVVAPGGAYVVAQGGACVVFSMRYGQ